MGAVLVAIGKRSVCGKCFGGKSFGPRARGLAANPAGQRHPIVSPDVCYLTGSLGQSERRSPVLAQRQRRQRQHRQR
ncbi:hypothetical protein PGN35_014560 [Nodosilinea sp. PGN35]